MPRPVFKPDVTLGDLLVLAKLGSVIHEQGSASPTSDVKLELNASSTRIRNALMRVAAVLGPVEVEGKIRRTQRPSPRGRNIGGAAVLADLLIKVAQDEATDQDRLLRAIEDLVEQTDNSYQSGVFKKRVGPKRF
tara:strand:- start:5107 stop:5511 length:405 start_codon:yes stop_codon:yes gene_type:complete